MAIVTATITVDFTANYTGNHRVCWRIQGSGDPYDCTTIVSCAGGGTTCQAIFTADVNTTSCDGTVTFEGYIQAACEDILSTNGRLAFQTDFTPTVVCQRTEILCARGGIATVIIAPAGQEYDITDTLTVVRDGADTETGDATLDITAVGSGVINTISSLLAGGSGYVALEVLNIVDGGGSGAGATITIDTILPGGIIDTYTLTTNGTDYIGPFTFTGGSGVGADFDIVDGVDYDVYGSILTVNIIAPGSYGITPTVTIGTATGSGAQVRVELEDCPPWVNIGTDCIGGDQVDLPQILDVGQVWATCLTGGLASPIPDEYDVTETGCCIPEDTVNAPCTDFHIENLTGVPQDVQYTACDGNDVTVNIADGISINVCAVLDGVVDPNIPGLTVTDTASPCT